MSKSFVCQAPSNIAFLKYWGKDDKALQWPSNDSISMTLSECFSETKVSSSESLEIDFNGESLKSESAAFQKIENKVKIIQKALNSSQNLRIETFNSFPTGAGIASSASGMAALTTAMIMHHYNADSWDELASYSWTREKISSLARLCSGSSCRSLWGGFVHWKKNQTPNEQRCQVIDSDLDLCDTIAVVDSKPKETSSTQGHGLAKSSPLFGLRIQQMSEKQELMSKYIATNDWLPLGQMIEDEALNMHAVMMSSEPALNYFSHETSRFLEYIRSLRRKTDWPVFFTLDAGPNVHLLHPLSIRDSLVKEIQSTWPDLPLIQDSMGKGPKIFTDKLRVESQFTGEIVENHTST